MALFWPFHWKGSTPDSSDDQFPWHGHCNYGVLPHSGVLDLYHFAIASLCVMTEVEVELVSASGFEPQASLAAQQPYGMAVFNFYH